MYLNSSAGGTYHIWRQRFPNGQPEQITSGMTEEEGLAMAPDGHSLITAVGLTQSSVWIHGAKAERQISLEGYSFDPKFTPDGKQLCYRILKGSAPRSDPSELRVVDLDSGRNEALLPGFAVTGAPGKAYDISPDGREVVVATLDSEGQHQLWVAPLDRRSPPHQIPNVKGENPHFGVEGEVLFNRYEGKTGFAYRVHEDGTGLRKVIDQPVAGLSGISRDGQWMVAKTPGPEGSSITAFPLSGGTPVHLIAGGAFGSMEINVSWPSDGKYIFISLPNRLLAEGASGRTYALPLPPGKVFPQLPPEGLRSEAEIAKLAGVRITDAFDVAPGPGPEVYALSRANVQRNLYRIPLP